MEATGKRLAKFRRNADMTQMEVAEHLGISFQAVSYWERGKTMPDIENLVSIARLYNVSIDSILDNDRQSQAVRSVYERRKTNDLLEIISIMKPSEIEQAIKNAQINVECFDILLDSVPYLETDVLSSLAEKNSSAVVDFNQVCLIASYINRESLDKIALDNTNKIRNFSQICEIACRMSRGAISKLADGHLTLPEHFSNICSIACFVEKETLCRLAESNKSKVDSFSQICSLACFVDKSTLNSLTMTNSKKVEDFGQINALASFVSEECLTALVFDNIEKIVTHEEVTNICHYMSNDNSEKFRKEMNMSER